MSLGLLSYRFMEGSSGFQFEAPDTQPESMLSTPQGLFYMKNGKLHRSGTGSNCNILGLYRPMKITIVAAQEPEVSKIFKALVVDATHKPTAVTIRTYQPDNNQYTTLVADDFEANEGKFYSDILGDANSPNSPGATDYARMINGDDMYGKYATIEMEFSYPGETVRLRHVDVVYTLSTGHS